MALLCAPPPESWPFSVRGCSRSLVQGATACRIRRSCKQTCRGSWPPQWWATAPRPCLVSVHAPPYECSRALKSLACAPLRHALPCGHVTPLCSCPPVPLALSLSSAQEELRALHGDGDDRDEAKTMLLIVVVAEGAPASPPACRVLPCACQRSEREALQLRAGCTKSSFRSVGFVPLPVAKLARAAAAQART